MRLTRADPVKIYCSQSCWLCMRCGPLLCVCRRPDKYMVVCYRPLISSTMYLYIRTGIPIQHSIDMVGVALRACDVWPGVAQTTRHMFGSRQIPYKRYNKQRHIYTKQTWLWKLSALQTNLDARCKFNVIWAFVLRSSNVQIIHVASPTRAGESKRNGSSISKQTARQILRDDTPLVLY